MAEKIRIVTLENLEPRLACYNLDHNHALPRVFPRVTKLKNGQEHGHFVEMKLPDSVTFLAREIKTLSASVLECDEIKSALEPRAHGARPRLRQRGDVVEQSDSEDSSSASIAPASPGDAPAEAVNTAAKKSRDAARGVLGAQATVEKGQV